MSSLAKTMAKNPEYGTSGVGSMVRTGQTYFDYMNGYYNKAKNDIRVGLPCGQIFGIIAKSGV